MPRKKTEVTRWWEAWTELYSCLRKDLSDFDADVVRERMETLAAKHDLPQRPARGHRRVSG